MILILVLFIALGVAVWYRRLHLMVHDPEKYQRFHEVEKKFAQVQVAATERAAKGLFAALRTALKFLLGKLFKKERNTPFLGNRRWNL